MDVNFSGVAVDVQANDTVTQLEVIWLAGTVTDLQAQASAESVNKVTITDSGEIADFFATGTVKNCGALGSGTVYTPAVRVTESRAYPPTVATGAWTAGSTFTYTAVGTPTSFAATQTTAALSWSAPVTGSPVGYNVYRAPDSSGSAGTYAFIGYTTSTTYTDSTVVAQTVYWYQVKAVNSFGEGSAPAAKRICPPNKYFDDSYGANGASIKEIATRQMVTLTGGSTLNIQNNAIQWYISGNGGVGVAMYEFYNIAYAAGVRLYIKVSTLPPTTDTDLLQVCFKDPGNGKMQGIRVTGTSIRHYAYDGSTELHTDLGSVAVAGDYIELSISGTSAQMYRNGSTLGTAKTYTFSMPSTMTIEVRGITTRTNATYATFALDTIKVY